MKIRTFIALEIGKEAIEEVLRIRDESLGPIQNVKWESRDKLHITLKFLGETDTTLVNSVIDSVQNVIGSLTKFTLEFERFGVFKQKGLPKILWVGLKTNTNLLKICSDLEDQMELFGFDKERREFKPHITLLRFRGSEDYKKLAELFTVKISGIKTTAEKLILYESKLLSTGSVYSPIHEFKLN